MEQSSTWSSFPAFALALLPHSPVCPFHTLAVNPVRSGSLPFSLPTLPDMVTTCQSDMMKESFKK